MKVIERLTRADENTINYEFTVEDMPVTVAVDTDGESVHKIGPQIWQAKIEEQAIDVA